MGRETNISLGAIMSNVINIKGKNYRLVADRVKQFRSMKEYEGYCLHTELLHFDGTFIILKGQVLDGNGMVISEGIASEKVGSSFINETSWAENCQTSAIGRTLAFLNEDLMGDSFPSADEMNYAMSGQDKIKTKVDCICEIIQTAKTENELRSLWETNNVKWKNEFGDNSFPRIEKTKNEMKKRLNKKVAA